MCVSHPPLATVNTNSHWREREFSKTLYSIDAVYNVPTDHVFVT